MTGQTPRELGYRMPAEWETHEGTWLIWPHNDTHQDSQLHLEHIWLEMTRVLQRSEVVHIIVPDELRQEHLEDQLSFYGIEKKNIDLLVIPNDDVWVRDCGPIFLVNDQEELAVTAWNFNGWGERYPFEKDRLVPEKAASRLGVPLFTAPITLEGGGIEVNGKGTLIATRSSIINANRNPNLDQAAIELAIKDYLGLDQIIWLSGAPQEYCDAIGDDTDYHIDGAARFTDENTILYTWIDDRSNHAYPYLKKHRDELKKARTAAGQPLDLIPLPVPVNEMYSTLVKSTREPFDTIPSLAIYTNFYIANGVVLVPVYGDILDADAKSIIGEHFPKREIVGIPAWATSERGGMMHCVTQQQPQAKLKS